MRFSRKIESCNLSPIRKFHPYAVEAEARGRKIYHLNIGQPDIETPKEFFTAIQNFKDPVLAYAPSAGIPSYVESVRGYYRSLADYSSWGYKELDTTEQLTVSVHIMHNTSLRCKVHILIYEVTHICIYP